MNYYWVYFEIYGKKMKVKIKANNANYAKELVRNKIIFHKVEDFADEQVNRIKNIFNINE